MLYALKSILLLTSLFLLTPNIRAETKLSCAKHKIYCSILTINPAVNKRFALELSNYIYRYSKKYQMDPLRTVAIIAQESMFRNINRKQDIVLFKENCDSEGNCTEYTQLATGYTDIGLYQFHARTIQAYGMDVLRLRDDIAYATEQHFYLMKEKLRECSDLGPDAWVCYHSRTPKFRNKYKRMVNRFYKKIKLTKEGMDAIKGQKKETQRTTPGDSRPS